MGHLYHGELLNNQRVHSIVFGFYIPYQSYHISPLYPMLVIYPTHNSHHIRLLILFPKCQVRVSRLYQVYFLLSSPPPLLRQMSVVTARPQL